jgi:hypothetical protein
MSSIDDGGLLTKDPQAIEVFTMDWDAQHLAVGVTIQTSTWTITGPDAILTKDNETIVTGNRKTRLRLTGGTLHRKYTVTNRIVTNESPAQTKDRSFIVQIVNA